MSLKQYASKRKFSSTSEPKPKKSGDDDSFLHFCVQKHAASHLHYDFRLEYRGVLLSWAVPKGPSLDPSIKRLAIQVEDHPLDYRLFEGVIPEGNYGAGTVELWDEGTYIVGEDLEKKAMEKKIKAGIDKGHIDFTLQGKKLKGDFSLIQLKNSKKGNEWLLIKKGSNKSEIIKASPLNSSKKSPMPTQVDPMLATLIEKPFNHEDWIFEIKWDGFRAIAYVDKSKVDLRSRNEKSFNDRFPTIVEALKNMKCQVILDGEIVALDENGKSHFQDMQNYQRTGKGQIFYYVFDILYLNGQDIRNEPLLKRKALLKEFLKSLPESPIRFSDHIETKGIPFFKEVSKKNLEGMMCKNASSSYQSRRSQDWLKVKHKLQQEFAIGGFTQPKGSREQFGALLIGTYKNKKLHYAGHVGGGFDRKLLKSIYESMKPLIQTKCPFEVTPKTNTASTWIKPNLVCEVTFAEWTSDGILRQPIFLGMREDKEGKEVTLEKPEKIKIKNSTKPKIELNPDFTHLDKVYFPEEGYKKEDILNYYKSISKYILPYLKDRPIVLRRYPEGIEGINFVQKDLAKHPDWIETVPVQHEGKVVHYLLIKNERSLLYAANLGSIEIHTFTSTIKDLEQPSYCVIDLDPEDISFDAVIKTALMVQEILESVGVKGYCKTSGATGLHIYIPLGAKYTTEQSLQFAKLIAHLTAQALPDITSVERSPSKRQKKVYVDYGQNNHGQTLAAPYSLRARQNAPVSTPLDWKEVKKGLDPKKFNIKTTLNRLTKLGDIYKPVLGKGADLGKALKKLA